MNLENTLALYMPPGTFTDLRYITETTCVRRRLVARTAEALLNAAAAANRSWRDALQDLVDNRLITTEAAESIISHMEGVYVTEGSEAGGTPLKSFFPTEREALADMRDVWEGTDVKLLSLVHQVEGVQTVIWTHRYGFEALEARMNLEGIHIE